MTCNYSDTRNYAGNESISEEQWREAENLLNMYIAECTAIGWAGSFALNLSLLPLKTRLDAGERTQGLYDEIMEIE